MIKFAFLIALVAVAVPSPAAAQGASGFSVVNQTGLNMTNLTIRRFGTQGWKALGMRPHRADAEAFSFRIPTAHLTSRPRWRASAQSSGTASICVK
ncbi:hypothetical protein H9L15_02050 [Sphingomonas daechungensis]|uniref:Uncharacterized protein n=1 Tax=Sphingomonas daechungensis TaxID=1176646 RepID=A0ABX6T145_9SPHN|nr:hypothetical protein [Sphingomonas daechungensis]QNP43562.1 hypothetical protein H9L15_02050 [Sphingomonas daechungensis]